MMCGSIQGNLSDGDHTDDAQPTLNGTGTPGDVIRVYVDGNFADEVPIDTNGLWSFTPAGALPDGQHIFTVSEVDEAGNESPQSDSFTLTVDTQSPGTPDIGVDGVLMAEDDVGPAIGEIQEGDTTDDANPRLFRTGFRTEW